MPTPINLLKPLSQSETKEKVFLENQTAITSFASILRNNSRWKNENVSNARIHIDALNIVVEGKVTIKNLTNGRRIKLHRTLDKWKIKSIDSTLS